MTTIITVELPDPVYRNLESLARRTRREVTEVVADAVGEVVARSLEPFPVNPNREIMEREAAAFRRLHPELLRDFAGRYVAITGGKVVDHDADPVALLTRIRRDYPGKTVLRRKVEPVVEKVLLIRSPRITQRL